MNESNPRREWAVSVVRRLRDAGHVAYFAGGCVRDQLLGNPPEDYDVATDAPPQRVQELFADRRTLAIGAVFGVIAVVGSRKQGTVEVAVFRKDLGYSDGRRPDAVAYCDAREDALRRDFTINGMFYDPLLNQVLDYVGGQADLQRGVIRAIGEPSQRFNEDKLRLLRAVRFTARFGFELESATYAAVSESAPKLTQVSPERISEELRKMSALPRRAQAWGLLCDTGLAKVIWPELQSLTTSDVQRIQFELSQLQTADFSLCMAVVLGALSATSAEVLREVSSIGKRLKWSNDEIADSVWLLKHRDALATADQQPWSRIQPILAHPAAYLLLDWSAARGTDAAVVAWCRERLAWPAEKLNPTPLLTGDDLVRAGYKPGPQFAAWLRSLRDQQLDGLINDSTAAWEWLLSQQS